MQYTTLGRTGLTVSRLGFGCMRLPMKGNYVDRDLSTPLLRRAVELGVNYFDTAVGYCNRDSQRALGEAMEGIRERVVLSTKNPHYNKEDERGWWKNLEDSLGFLRTDYINIYNHHGLRWARFVEQVREPDGIIQWMLRAKEQGLIRHICFSFHDTSENLKKLASTGYFDSVTLQYNLLDRSNQPAFEHVGKKCGMGIVVMGPVGGGRLGADSEEIRGIIRGARSVPEVALRFVLATPYVSVALSGMSDIKMLEENVAATSRKTPLSTTEKRRVSSILSRFKKLADLYCTGCNYCMPCPAGVNISDNFMALNYERVYGLREHAKQTYAKLGGGQASYCLACGKCLSKCPQNIEIIRQLKETVRTLDDAYGTLVVQVLPTTLKSFDASGKGWKASFSGKLDLHNLSDQPIEARVTFEDANGTSTRPQESSVVLEEFARKSKRLTFTCQSKDNFHLVHLGAVVEGAERIALSGNSFPVAFAAPLGKSGRAPRRKALALALHSKEQLAKGNSRTLAKHGVQFHFTYDDKALHLLADVRDDAYQPAAVGRSFRVTDRLTLSIDARPIVRLGRPGPDSQVFQIIFPAPGKDDVPGVRVGPWGSASEELLCKSRTTKDGYHIEAAIPWKFLGVTKSGRKHLGFDLALTSHNRKGKQNLQMYWASAESPGSPSHFGHLFLLP